MWTKKRKAEKTCRLNVTKTETIQQRIRTQQVMLKDGRKEFRKMRAVCIRSVGEKTIEDARLNASTEKVLHHDISII